MQRITVLLFITCVVYISFSLPMLSPKKWAEEKFLTSNQSEYYRDINYFEKGTVGSCRLYFEFGGRVLRTENITTNITAGVDGQKAVCLDPGLAPPPTFCVVYSFGVSDEWSFEVAMSAYDCDVYVFDPSVQFLGYHPVKTNNSEHIHHFNIGLGTVNRKKDYRGKKNDEISYYTVINK